MKFLTYETMEENEIILCKTFIYVRKKLLPICYLLEKTFCRFFKQLSHKHIN